MPERLTPRYEPFGHRGGHPRAVKRMPAEGVEQAAMGEVGDAPCRYARIDRDAVESTDELSERMQVVLLGQRCRNHVADGDDRIAPVGHSRATAGCKRCVDAVAQLL